MTQIAAIFDLDETLLTDASGRLFAQYLRKTGQLSRFVRKCYLNNSVWALLLHSFGLMSTGNTIVQVACLATGIDATELWEIVHHWGEECVQYHIPTQAKEKLTWHCKHSDL